MATNASTLGSLVAQNPLLQDYAAKSVYKSVMGEEPGPGSWFGNDDEEGGHPTHTADPHDPTVIQCDEQELEKIRLWARNLKVAMLVLATLMGICAWYNISGSNSIANGFLAVYLFFFSILLCCYEVAIRRVAVVVADNFGFMYNMYGRLVFLLFISMICFSLSTFGTVIFALMICYCVVYLYVSSKHPQFNIYLRSMHFFNRVKAANSASVNNHASAQV